jgi:hypothetical protein
MRRKAGRRCFPKGYAQCGARRPQRFFRWNDARPAAEHLLYSGPIRLKPIHACAGRGQEVIKSLDQFDDILARPEAENPVQRRRGAGTGPGSKSITHSVGQSFIGDKVLSYCGDQYLTNDAQGEEVYGGSNLLVVQGGYEDLLALDLADDVRLAIRQAQVFDNAANEAYPRFYASRRNYDIAQGLDSGGVFRSGVLEQSWRMGGASSAEVAALAELHQRPGDARDPCVLSGNLHRPTAAGGRHRGIPRPGREQRISSQIRNGQIL